MDKKQAQEIATHAQACAAVLAATLEVDSALVDKSWAAAAAAGVTQHEMIRAAALGLRIVEREMLYNETVR